MYTVTLIQGNKTEKLTVNGGEKLSDLLMHNGKDLEHPCAGRGMCKKCSVSVNGRDELSCRYTVNSDVTVILPERTENEVIHEKKFINGNTCLVLDIGTTTLEMAIVSSYGGRMADSITMPNPQRIFGADVMSRIGYAAENSVDKMQSVLIDAVNEMTEKLLGMYECDAPELMYVSGNTTMLHIFFGEDCSAMGVSPYTPVFLESRKIEARIIGLYNVKTVISLPNISAFVGADIVAGMNFAGMPEENKYNLLIDLGTNAEIVLYSRNKAICTAAAAGPCFEGASISCGMSASEGAVCRFSFDIGAETIGNAPPAGLCATGLIDVAAELVKHEIIDETGLLADGIYEIAENVVLTQEDVRRLQLAKSAVYSAVLTLLKNEGISYRDIDSAFIAGGFAGKLNIPNAVSLGLLPMELMSKYKVLDNSSLAGTVKYAAENNDLSEYIKNSQYADLSNDKTFSELFIENMMFRFYEQ